MAIINRFNTKLIEGDTESELNDSPTIYDHNVFIYAKDTNVLKKGNNNNKFSELPIINKGDSESYLVFTKNGNSFSINNVNGDYDDIISSLTNSGIL